MNEDLYALLFETVDVSDIKDWDLETPYFEISVAQLDHAPGPYDRKTAPHGFFQLCLSNTRSGDVRYLADFATLDDAETAITTMQEGVFTLENCLNDIGRYCVTVWTGLMDAVIRGALNAKDFDAQAAVEKIRDLQMTSDASVKPEPYGDLSARVLGAAGQFFSSLVTQERQGAGQ